MEIMIADVIKTPPIYREFSKHVSLRDVLGIKANLDYLLYTIMRNYLLKTITYKEFVSYAPSLANSMRILSQRLNLNKDKFDIITTTDLVPISFTKETTCFPINVFNKKIDNIRKYYDKLFHLESEDFLINGDYKHITANHQNINIEFNKTILPISENKYVLVNRDEHNTLIGKGFTLFEVKEDKVCYKKGPLKEFLYGTIVNTSSYTGVIKVSYYYADFKNKNIVTSEPVDYTITINFSNKFEELLSVHSNYIKEEALPNIKGKDKDATYLLPLNNGREINIKNLHKITYLSKFLVLKDTRVQLNPDYKYFNHSTGYYAVSKEDYKFYKSKGYTLSALDTDRAIFTSLDKEGNTINTSIAVYRIDNSLLLRYTTKEDNTFESEETTIRFIPDFKYKEYKADKHIIYI